ncbi:hypothetical protein ABET51_02715 [Metabacillus fastidiosus]|uniref:hypothetical protein n=1 Tax=Metabacillus fastidiosus TaxID=1458 RepID=UPI003D2CB0E8
MEKTIEIDGKEISFKSTGGSAIRYKAQFGKDFFAEVVKLNSLEKLTKIDTEDFKPEDLEGLDTTFFYNVAWVFAKTANKEIPDQLAWLDSFDEFPIMDIMPDLMELVTAALKTKKK